MKNNPSKGNNMRSITKKFIKDYSHAWLSVKAKEIIEVGIEDKISSYSYMKGKSVYLEEDCDANVYIMAQKEHGTEVKIIEGKCTKSSPVRSYKNYRKNYLNFNV